MSRIDVSEGVGFERSDIAASGDASVRPSDEQYLRYATLVKAIAKDNFGPGPFAVYDPFMSAALGTR